MHDPNLLVGAATADDAGVYRLDRDRALVQTVDFFTPIVDDPFAFGQIAAANALSDIYAMGGRPLTALNLLCVPDEVLPLAVINAILRGGARKAQEARCVIIGGHTIRNPELVYGLAVTGLVHPRKLITNAAARPGDVLVLTKPLGTGIVTTGIKRGVTAPALARKAAASMRQLNTIGAELAERDAVRAGTDVTGFGLLGHLGALCRSSGVGAQIRASAIPVLGEGVWELIERNCVPAGTKQNLKAAATWTDWAGVTEAQQILLADAQTSGGLLLCVRPRKLAGVLRLLEQRHVPCAAVLGRIVPSAQPWIHVSA